MTNTGNTQTASSSKRMLWTGRIISALMALFLLFDAVAHVLQPAPVVEAFARLGFPRSLAVGIGIIELVCIAAYVIPRTSVLGAILLTGYLGGATAVQARAGSPLFEESFAVIIGVLIWAGLFLQDSRLREFTHLRNVTAR